MPKKTQAESLGLSLVAAEVRPARESVPLLPPSLPEDFEAVRLLLDAGRPLTAESKVRYLLRVHARHPALVAEARRLSSIGFEMQGRATDALDAIKDYEADERRAALDVFTEARVLIQTANAYILRGEQPKAIALANAALRLVRATGSRGELSAEAGAAHIALARAYRDLTEVEYARENLEKAQRELRASGDWRGLAEVYITLGSVAFYKGEWETLLSYHEQAVKIIGNRPAYYLLSRVYSNCAAACVRGSSAREGLRYLEQATALHQSMELQSSATIVAHNLSYNLILVGEWQRAHQTLIEVLEYERAARKDYRSLAMTLDSLGELAMLREHFDEAEGYVNEAVRVMHDRHHKFYKGMCLRTRARLHLAQHQLTEAHEALQTSLQVAAETDNKQFLVETRLLLAEVALANNDVIGATREVRLAQKELQTSGFDVLLTYEAARLEGLVALASGKAESAVHHFGRSLSAAELRADAYRTAQANFDLGCALGRVNQIATAAEHLHRAAEQFRALGVARRVMASEQALHQLTTETASQPFAPPADTPPAIVFSPEDVRAVSVTQSVVPRFNTQLIERLTAASTATGLLLRELAACLAEVTDARCVVVFQKAIAEDVAASESAVNDAHEWRIVCAHGAQPADLARLRARCNRLPKNSDRQTRFVNLIVPRAVVEVMIAIESRSDTPTAAPTDTRRPARLGHAKTDVAPVDKLNVDDAIRNDSTTYKSPVEILTTGKSNVDKPNAAESNDDALKIEQSLATLLKVAELGLETCALRESMQRPMLAEALHIVDYENVLPGFVCASAAMRRVVDEIRRIRASNVTVLITGESGTGKEVVARAVHQLSHQNTKSFVPFNCTAVPRELAEAYLFGYRRGAFTGATTDAPGLIRTAHGGTLLLDEIGDLPLELQPKLLRFLQEGEIQPIGEPKPIKVDARIVAATNANLEKLVAEGKFREDLYYRLNVIRLHVPPLRERRAEIPALINYYLELYAAKFNRRALSMARETIDILIAAEWRGNVRQLCNEMQRLVARASDETTITPDMLSPALADNRYQPRPELIDRDFDERDVAATPDGHAPANLNAAVNQLEAQMIRRALSLHDKNISRAARELGLTRRGLYLKLERYAIDLENL